MSAPFPQAGYGIMVGGLPVGDTTFIDDKLSAKVVRILEDNKKISDYLRSYSSAGLFAVLWHCCQPLLQHEVQNLPPRLLSPHLPRFDDSLRCMVTDAGKSSKIAFRNFWNFFSLFSFKNISSRGISLQRFRLHETKPR